MTSVFVTKSFRWNIVPTGWKKYKNSSVLSRLKPIILGGLIIGDILFSISMAILGECPATGPVSIAEGRIDVLVGDISGLFGGLVFTVYFDFFKKIMGESLGNTTLITYFQGHENLTVLVFGIILIAVSIVIPLRQEFDEADLNQIKE